MARPLRLEFEGAWYHVMNKASGGEMLFRDREDRITFLELLDLATGMTGAEVHAYCMMGTHYHLLMRTPEGNLSEVMHCLGWRYARYFNDKYRSDGAVCRSRYKAILVDTERYLLGVSRYIHRNPIDLGVRVLGEYGWSSYGAFLGIRPPQHWLELEETLEIAGGRDAYESLVESPLPSELDAFYNRGNQRSVLGSAEFIELAKAKTNQWRQAGA